MPFDPERGQPSLKVSRLDRDEPCPKGNFSAIAPASTPAAAQTNTNTNTNTVDIIHDHLDRPEVQSTPTAGRSTVAKRYRERAKEKIKAEIDSLRREIVDLKKDNTRLAQENAALRESVDAAHAYRDRCMELSTRMKAIERSRRFALIALNNIADELRWDDEGDRKPIDSGSLGTNKATQLVVDAGDWQGAAFDDLPGLGELEVELDGAGL